MRKDKPIITSLLDTDLYKFTMQQTMLHHFGNAEGEYAFKCRTADVDLTPLVGPLREEIEALCNLRIQFSELKYLETLRFIKPSYLSFLEGFQLNPKHLTIDVVQGQLSIRAKGPIVQSMMFEIYVLAIVQELYMRYFHPEVDLHVGRQRLTDKIELLKGAEVPDFRIADFGTRRRFSKYWQYHVVEQLKKRLPDQLVGTSNVYLAKELGLKPIGTMAHEYLQAFQAFTNPEDSQTMALETWVKEFRGDLGVALTDVIGMDFFLKDLDLYFAKLFDGFRHDSGEPKAWAEKLIAHLERLGIDPALKSAVFSDGLTMEKAIDLYQTFKGRIQTSFGIGTHLTNDMGVAALNNVMKLVNVNGKPVAKLSDSPGKTMCEDHDYVNYLQSMKNRFAAQEK